ncbi:DUF1565 domain-containing protein [Methanobrevibacter sp.]|uniref:DUF1565 domain-containing protein n=1 Tax=Methanobrevibacter sp. TaxID=66852 RepID=UPI00388F66B5
MIYTESFEEDDFVDTFEYSYSHSTLDDGYAEDVVIPPDSFRLYVETWTEHIIEKGYPENDTQKGDIFDHDISLDEIGALHDIPRKEYLTGLSPNLYPATEPPYNNQKTEDDYHYMKRIITYAEKLHTTPAPILEIWKLYGIDATMENREKLILKFFDESKHIDEETGLYNPDWIPEPWEHKDTFCSYEQVGGKFLFITPETNMPTVNNDLMISFKILDAFGKEIEEDYTYTIKIQDTIIATDLTENQFIIPKKYLNTSGELAINVICLNKSQEIISDETVYIRVRGCSDADWYVSPIGSNNNDGMTINTPFKTITKALQSVQTNANLIACASGNYSITQRMNVPRSAVLIGCGNVNLINNNAGEYFRLTKKKSLSIQNITLKYGNISTEVINDEFVNVGDIPLIVDILAEKLTLNSTKKIYRATEEIELSGVLTDKNGFVANADIDLYCNDIFIETLSTNENGEFEYSSLKETGIYIFKVDYENNEGRIRESSIKVTVGDYDFESLIEYLNSLGIFSLVNNLTYDDHILSYSLETIEDSSSFNNVIYNLEYENGILSCESIEISQETIESGIISDELWEEILNAVVTISYENSILTCTTVNDYIR